MNRVSTLCGKSLPISLLFTDATVAGLVRAVSTPVMRQDDDVVTLQPKGSRPPFFYGDGDLLSGGLYTRAFLEQLGSDQPFYLMRPCKSVDLTIEEIAEMNLRKIRSVAPRGPYCLGGFCSDGLVALEMAQRLRSVGEEVRMLLLVDPPSTGTLERFVFAFFKSVSDILRLTSERRLKAMVPWLYRANTLRSALQSPRAALKLLQRKACGKKQADADAAHERLGDGISLLLARNAAYKPRPYDGYTVLIQAETTHTENPFVLKQWNVMCKALKSTILPTTHFGLVTHQAHAVSKCIKNALDEIDAK
jgi:thioesterase domain-containing protein